MKLKPTILIAVFLLTTACAVSRPVGIEIKVPEIDQEVRTKCPEPGAFLHIRDWEIMAGHLGDALIDCEGRRSTAVDGYDGLAAILEDDVGRSAVHLLTY